MERVSLKHYTCFVKAWGCLVCVFKQLFSVFKQYFTYFHTLFHPHVFSQMFSNNNFQFLNTYTKRVFISRVFETRDISKIYTFETVFTNYIIRKMGLVASV